MTLLRPEWLILWLPLAFLLLRERKRSLTGWQEWVDAPLLQALTRQSPVPWPRLQTYAPWAGLFTLILALAGPATERVLPNFSLERPVIVVLDQSISMGSTDIAPSRHVRAQQKVQDWLQLHPSRPVGLIVYSGTAHVVSPITTDQRAILGFLQQTDPFIMPAFGSQPVAAMNLALQLLGDEPGDILWFTDDLTPQQAQRLPSLSSEQQLGMIVVGTRVGAPINLPNGNRLQLDNGELLIPSVDTTAISQWVNSQPNARWAAVSIDDYDLQSVLPTVYNPSSASAGERRQWHDWGPWLVLLALPGLALWWRRGALFTLCFAVAFITAPKAEAQGWRDWFRNADAQGLARLKTDPQAAYERFQDPQWKAYAALQGQAYPEAQAILNADDTALGHYNRGHALVNQGEFEAALAAFEAALSVQSDFAEAEHNRALLEQFLQQEPQQNEPPQDEPQQNEPPESDSDASEQDESNTGNDSSDGADGDRGTNGQTGENTDSIPPRSSADPADRPSSPAQTPESPSPGAEQNVPSSGELPSALDEQIRRQLPTPQQPYLQRRFRFEYEIDPNQYDSGGPLW